MNIKPYEFTSDGTFNEYKFTSTGTNGTIEKGIVFSLVNEGVYNIALGDIDPISGYLDDQARSNNGDMEKILSTVAGCIYYFLEKNPESAVFAQGNTPAKNRLYKGAINKYLDHLDLEFRIWGLQNKKWLSFEKDSVGEYEGFLIKKKKN